MSYRRHQELWNFLKKMVKCHKDICFGLKPTWKNTGSFLTGTESNEMIILCISLIYTTFWIKLPLIGFHRRKKMNFTRMKLFEILHHIKFTITKTQFIEVCHRLSISNKNYQLWYKNGTEICDIYLTKTTVHGFSVTSSSHSIGIPFSIIITSLHSTFSFLKAVRYFISRFFSSSGEPKCNISFMSIGS